MAEEDNKVKAGQTLVTGKKRAVTVSNKRETHRPEALVKPAPATEDSPGSMVETGGIPVSGVASKVNTSPSPVSNPSGEIKSADIETSVSKSDVKVKMLDFGGRRKTSEYSAASPLSILLPRIGGLDYLAQHENFLEKAREALKDTSSSRDRNPITERSMIQQVLDWLSMGRR